MMHRTALALAAAAVLAAAAPAVAQQTTPTTTTTTTATANTPATSTPTYDQLVSAMGRTRSATGALASMRGLMTNNVRIVKVQTLITPQNSGAFTAALAQNQAQLQTLRRTLSGVQLTASTDNSKLTLAQFLADNRIDLTHVVAADVSPPSNVTIYVQ